MIELRRRIMVSVGSGRHDYPQGIWAYYADGSIRNYETADSNAIGVALITNNVAFVIDKQRVSTGTYPYGGGRINLDAVKQRKVWNDAKLDFDGNDMTTSLISTLRGVTDYQGVTGAPASEYCRTRFGGKGYLGAGGEYQEIYDNKNDINSMMSKIGGQQLAEPILTANPANPGYETENSVWTLNFNNGNGASSIRNNNLSYVCALMPLTSSVEPIEPDGDFVDLGLPSGLLWATCNIGATTPEGVGLFFSKGNIEGHEYGDGSSFNSSAYANTPGASVTGDVPTNSTYDAARAILGGTWRLPTKGDFKELVENTDNEYSSLNGFNGWKFMKKSDHSVFAFFPATGRYAYEQSSITGYNATCMYWSSTYYQNNTWYALYFNASYIQPENQAIDCSGFQIRGVCNS